MDGQSTLRAKKRDVFQKLLGLLPLWTSREGMLVRKWMQTRKSY